MAGTGRDEGFLVAGMDHAGRAAGRQLVEFQAARRGDRPLQKHDRFAVDLPSVRGAVVPHRAVASDACGLGQCPGDLVEQRFDGAKVGHHPAQTRDQSRRHVAQHDVIGRLGVFEMADARLDGGELRLLGIDAPRDRGPPLGQQMAHQFGRRVVLQQGANAVQRQAERAQHHQAVQLVGAIAGGAIDVRGLQEADRFVVA